MTYCVSSSNIHICCAFLLLLCVCSSVSPLPYHRLSQQAMSDSDTGTSSGESVLVTDDDNDEPEQTSPQQPSTPASTPTAASTPTPPSASAAANVVTGATGGGFWGILSPNPVPTGSSSHSNLLPPAQILRPTTPTPTTPGGDLDSASVKPKPKRKRSPADPNAPKRCRKKLGPLGTSGASPEAESVVAASGEGSGSDVPADEKPEITAREAALRDVSASFGSAVNHVGSDVAAEGAPVSPAMNRTLATSVGDDASSGATRCGGLWGVGVWGPNGGGAVSQEPVDGVPAWRLVRFFLSCVGTHAVGSCSLFRYAIAMAVVICWQT